MRQYLYVLAVDQGTSKPIELFLIYAIDEEDAQKKARKRTIDYPGAEIALRRCKGLFTVVHSTYPPYIDVEEGMC